VPNATLCEIKLKIMPLEKEFGHEWPEPRPLPDRERFSPSEKNKIFLQECREKGYDISTIINLALDTFAPKTGNSNFTWEGIENVASGKRKWY